MVTTPWSASADGAEDEVGDVFDVCGPRVALLRLFGCGAFEAAPDAGDWVFGCDASERVDDAVAVGASGCALVDVGGDGLGGSAGAGGVGPSAGSAVAGAA